MFAWQFAKAQETARRLGSPRFVSMQNHYNLVYREEEREMIPLCAEEGVGLIPWSPLARGLLAGSRGRGDQRLTVRSGSDKLVDEYYGDADVAILDALRGVADARGVSPAQIALAWLLRRGVTAPILGATTVRHVDDAVAATHTELSDAETLALESPYRPRTIRGHR
jgi:aryl-alcohol dehydrogenase-like predicted oxidoreductase